MIEQFIIEDSLGHMVAKTHQLFSSYFKEKLSPYNLTPPQFGTLAFLWKNNGISQIQLGTLMMKDRTTLTGIIDRLEKENLVVRRDDPDDRRTHLIFLTPRGKALQDELESLAQETIFEITASLTEPERDLLGQLLKKIIKNTRHTK